MGSSRWFHVRPEFFKSVILGFWSSLPESQRRRRHLVLVLACIPFGFFVAGCVLLAVNFRNWLALVQNASTLLTVGAVATLFMLGTFLTLALCSRWSEVSGSFGRRARPFEFINLKVVGVA